jgi:hypothetical protein
VLRGARALVVKDVAELALHEAMGAAACCAVQHIELACYCCHAHAIQGLAQLPLGNLLGQRVSICRPPAMLSCTALIWCT